jgi:type IV secretion system protein VirD4
VGHHRRLSVHAFPCLFFNPTRPDSARFNPLFEIRKGANEIRDAQNIVEMLVNPTGAKHTMDIWDQQASQFLVALILHVLYTEPDDHKESGDGAGADCWISRTHQQGDDPHAAPASIRRPACPEVHPEVALVANELRRQPEKVSGQRVRHGGQLPHALGGRHRCPQHGHQRLSAERPGLRGSAHDALPPAAAIGRAALAPAGPAHDQSGLPSADGISDRDSSGRAKRHRLLLSLDEFPTLGRLDFFTMNLRQMAGYGIKAHLIVQSFNDIIEQYGVNNTILDNCHILTTFAAADTVTCQRISQMTGTVTEYRESYSQPGDIGALEPSATASMSGRYCRRGYPGIAGGRSARFCHRVQTDANPEEGPLLRRSTFMARLSASAGPIGVSECPGKPKIDWLHERPKGPQLTLPASPTTLLSDARSPVR